MTARDNIEKISEALACAISGRNEQAANAIQAVVAKGPGHIYAMWCGLAEVVVRPQRETAAPDEFFGLVVETADGRPANIEDTPPALRLAIRFMTAQANLDNDSTVALLQTGLDHDPGAVGEATEILFQAAVATSRELIARRKAGGS
jgi:hypothetical protein